MGSIVTYYDVLHISRNADIEQIKSAFRRLAKMCHPDYNKSAMAQSAFILLHNAYSVLCDVQKRREYDFYIDSMPLQHQPKPAVVALSDKENETELRISTKDIFSHINYFLWDIEIFLRKEYTRIFDLKISGLSVRQYVLKMLVFIDKWILSPAGYKDYFAQARQMKDISYSQYLSMIDTPRVGSPHRPFYSIENYFYDIRKRSDLFIDKTPVDELFRLIPGSGIRLIDAIIETQNYVIHYMASIKKAVSGDAMQIAPFVHTNEGFEE